MESIQAIAEAVTNIVKLMVDKPDDVSVEVVPVPGGILTSEKWVDNGALAYQPGLNSQMDAMRRIRSSLSWGSPSKSSSVRRSSRRRLAKTKGRTE